MKKLLILTLCIFSTIIAQDFRNSNWGETIQQVKSKEKSKLIVDINDNTYNAIAYDDIIMGFDVMISYFFNNENKLYMAGYNFKINHIAYNKYFDDFNKIYNNISIKYGDGIITDKLTQDVYKDDLGFSLKLGYYSKWSVWKTSNSTITLSLSGDNLEINLMVNYKSNTIKNIEKSHF